MSIGRMTPAGWRVSQMTLATHVLMAKIEGDPRYAEFLKKPGLPI